MREPVGQVDDVLGRLSGISNLGFLSPSRATIRRSLSIQRIISSQPVLVRLNNNKQISFRKF